VNKDGWFITAAHLFLDNALLEQHKKEIAAYEVELKKLQDQGAPKRELKKLAKQKNPKWIRNTSVWPGRDNQRVVDGEMLPEVDLAIGRLEPFDPESVFEYPVFKNPTGALPVGISLCKLGYPFSDFKVGFDHNKGQFALDLQNLVPFPLEGIYTRDVLGPMTQDQKYRIRFIETSSPGLLGQSGGPIFDRDGTVWAVQSRTVHLPLGFTAKIQRGGREIEENQIINLGLGIHPELLVQFMSDHKISFSMTD